MARDPHDVTADPYTVRDGALGVDEHGDWSVVEPLRAGLLPGDEPCLVVTGDLAAARRRLAPLPADTRAAATAAVYAAETGVDEYIHKRSALALAVRPVIVTSLAEEGDA